MIAIIMPYVPSIVTDVQVQEICKQMGKLILALRFGNESYYKGNNDLALANYKDVAEMMEGSCDSRISGLLGLLGLS